MKQEANEACALLASLSNVFWKQRIIKGQKSSSSQEHAKLTCLWIFMFIQVSGSTGVHIDSRFFQYLQCKQSIAVTISFSKYFWKKELKTGTIHKVSN